MSTAILYDIRSPEDKAADYDVQMATQWEDVPSDPLSKVCWSPFKHITNENGRGSRSVFAGPCQGHRYTLTYSPRKGEWACSCGATKHCWHRIAFEMAWLPEMLKRLAAVRQAEGSANTYATAATPKQSYGFGSREAFVAAVRNDFG